MGATHNGAP